MSNVGNVDTSEQPLSKGCSEVYGTSTGGKGATGGTPEHGDVERGATEDPGVGSAAVGVLSAAQECWCDGLCGRVSDHSTIHVV